jgi:hypothetical protein
MVYPGSAAQFSVCLSKAIFCVILQKSLNFSFTVVCCMLQLFGLLSFRFIIFTSVSLHIFPDLALSQKEANQLIFVLQSEVYFASVVVSFAWDRN